MVINTKKCKLVQLSLTKMLRYYKKNQVEISTVLDNTRGEKSSNIQTARRIVALISFFLSGYAFRPKPKIDEYPYRPNVIFTPVFIVCYSTPSQLNYDLLRYQKYKKDLMDLTLNLKKKS